MTSFQVDISRIELYNFLGIHKYAPENEIKKAYKKLALKLHPDKNSNKQDAVEKFQLLQKVIEVLTDATKKYEYDQSLMANEKAEKKRQEMNTTTKLFKSKFGEDERKYKEKRAKEEQETKRRNDLTELLKEEERIKITKERENKLHTLSEDNLGYNVKVYWKTKKKDVGPAYTTEEITDIFSNFGEILHVVKSKTKENLYLINYADKESAVFATTVIGKSSHPLSIILADNLQKEACMPSLYDILRKYGIMSEENITVKHSANKYEPELKEIDEKSGLPIKYIYKNGTDALFSCAATFVLPKEIKLEGDEEVVYNNYLVRLRPNLRI